MSRIADTFVTEVVRLLRRHLVGWLGRPDLEGVSIYLNFKGGKVEYQEVSKKQHVSVQHALK